MTRRLFPIPVNCSGNLAIVTRPRGGDWLRDDLDSFHREHKLDLLVSALTDREMKDLDLEDESTLLRRGPILFRRFPISDLGLPEDEEEFRRAVLGLLQDLRAGRNIAVHCRMGIGRSTLICASILIAEGGEPREVLDRIRQARGIDVPDTEEQRQWILKWKPNPA